jgi:hypothetical protein
MLKPEFDLESIGINPGDIEKDAAELLNGSSPGSNFFIVKPVMEWNEEASQRPIPNKLVDTLWFEGELCICYADTNLGKSILAVQISDSITKGCQADIFTLEAGAQPVLYFDFELSDKQFQTRYTDEYGNLYQFDSKFLRAEINPDTSKPDQFPTVDDFIIYSIEHEIIRTGVKIVIVDNITYLRGETEKAKDALPLMKLLKDLKKKYHLSILVLAHTPKRDQMKPITRNDLAGSKMIINFCDSAFALGESCRDKSLRYIKQMKQRNCENTYDTENVIVMELKKAAGFLGFHFHSYGQERDHLKDQNEKDHQNRLNQALLLRDEGKSNVEIGKMLGVTEGAIRKMFRHHDKKNP